jgi:hypothetical protein
MLDQLTLRPQVAVGLSVNDLLAELEQRFPERSAYLGDELDTLMFMGGERHVVRWIKSRLEQED